MKKGAIAAIEELVRSVAGSAAQSKVKLSEKTEALRVLAPYYVALKKHKIDITDEPAEAVTIGNLQDAVRKAEDHNGRAVPDHQRRERSAAPVED